ncbi:MAG: M55 family metallopeptidase [Ignisphaera sp.]
MKAYVSVDLEGMPYIVSPEHLGVKGSLFNEARKITTKITVYVAEVLHKLGFDEVIIADSHGSMVTIDVENLPEYVYIVRGWPRPISMVIGVEKTDAVVFLGYHAKAGALRATFDHTFSSAKIDSIEVNGIEVSEYLFNAYIAGHYNVPIILVAGDKALIEGDVAKYTPWVKGVVFKEALSRYSCISPSLSKILNDLEKSLEESVRRFKKGEIPPVKAKYPMDIKVRFLGTEMADTAELLGFVERIDGKTIRFTAKDVIEAYKIFDIILLANPRPQT